MVGDTGGDGGDEGGDFDKCTRHVVYTLHFRLFTRLTWTYAALLCIYIYICLLKPLS